MGVDPAAGDRRSPEAAAAEVRDPELGRPAPAEGEDVEGAVRERDEELVVAVGRRGVQLAVAQLLVPHDLAAVHVDRVSADLAVL